MHVPSYRCEPEVVYAEDIQNTSSGHGELRVQYSLYYKDLSVPWFFLLYTRMHVLQKCLILAICAAKVFYGGYKLFNFCPLAFSFQPTLLRVKVHVCMNCWCSVCIYKLHVTQYGSTGYIGMALVFHH